MRTIDVQPNAENATPEQLRVAMEAAPNKRSYIRLAAIRSLLMGIARSVVCQQFCGADRMARLWIEMFNRGGIDALATKPRSGRPRKAKLDRVGDWLVPALKDPASAGQVHWTGVKIHGFIQEKLSIELGCSTVLRWIHELDFHLRVPRPWPERQDPEKREVFQKELQALLADPSVQLWYSDESGVEGDPRPRRRWAQPGKPRTVPYLGDPIRQNVIGAVAPQTGELFCLIFDGVDGDVFQFYLDEMAKAIPPKPGQRNLFILDNASWHKGASLNPTFDTGGLICGKTSQSLDF